MTLGKLPPQDTDAGQAIIKRFWNGELEQLTWELGYKNTSTLKGALRKIYGIYITKVPWQPRGNVGTKPLEIIIKPAPIIKVKPIKQEGRRGEGEEIHLQPIGDAHCGVQTPSYNVAIFKERLIKLLKAMAQLCFLHRKMRPIKKLVVPFLGDLVQGEQYGVQGFVEEYEISALEQIYDVLVPEFSNFFINLLQIYPNIEIYGVEGNHGNIQRKAQIMTKRSNWDIVFYRALKQALAQYSRIEVKTQEVGGEFYQVIDVNGLKILIVHGDMIVSYQGVPFYGLEKRGLRWKQSIGGREAFDCILSGHLHNPNYLWNAGISWWVNGCICSDTKFPLTRMGLKDVSSQWSMFVNRKYGVTAQYRINLA